MKKPKVEKLVPAERASAVVKEIRTRYGLSQGQLAIVTGIEKNTIQKWEQGLRSPSEYVPYAIECMLIVEGCKEKDEE